MVFFWHIYSEIDHKMCTTRFEIKSFHFELEHGINIGIEIGIGICSCS